MGDRGRHAARRRRRRRWLAAVALRLDEAAVLVDALDARGIAAPGLGHDIAAARMMVNALSAANGS